MDSRGKLGQEGSGEQPQFVRRKYLIDAPTQLQFGFGLLFGVLCALAGVAGLCILASRVGPDGDLPSTSEPANAARLVWWINGAYFVFAAAAMLMISIRFTHRFIGPGRVIEKALSRMCEGDYSSRLKLRDRDKLQDVALTTGRLAGVLAKREAWLNRLASGLEEAVAKGDLESIREHSIQLRSHVGGAARATAPVKPSTVGV